MDKNDFTISVENEPFVLRDEEPSRCIKQTTFWLEYAPEDEEPKRVGHIITATYLAGLAMNMHEDIIDCADAVDQEVYEGAEMAFRKGECLRDDLEDEGYFEYNIILLSRIFLEPEVRGHDLGALFLEAVINWLDPPTYLAMIVFPNCKYYFTDHKGSKAKTEDPYAERALSKLGPKRLNDWYERLGFKRWRDSRYYYLLMEHWAANHSFQPASSATGPHLVAD